MGGIDSIEVPSAENLLFRAAHAWPSQWHPQIWTRGNQKIRSEILSSCPLFILFPYDSGSKEVTPTLVLLLLQVKTLRRKLPGKACRMDKLDSLKA